MLHSCKIINIDHSGLTLHYKKAIKMLLEDKLLHNMDGKLTIERMEQKLKA
nr:MAG TPA: hypothetical protein [Caudoviricetes sp.]